MVLAVAIKLIFSKNSRRLSFAFLGLIIFFPVLAYLFIPSFQNRVKFFLYEKEYFVRSNYLAGGTDATRVISLKAGWDLMNQYPFAGVGFGDIRPEVTRWYNENYPGIKEVDKIYPSSEWLMYGAGSGWPGFVIFTSVMLLPFFSRVHHRWCWQLICGVVAFSLLFDIGLEVQLGIFIYAFIILWFWKWFNAEII